jgi:dTDP-4-amino-4,6-dideoxygalactose transaminase
MAATSFFPAKPLGCYGDGGAVFTDSDELAVLLTSIREHGKGSDKYHNARIGLNARLDTIQAAVLLEKLTIFDDELKRRNDVAALYNKYLKDKVVIQAVKPDYRSSWAQYSILAKDSKERVRIREKLKADGIPTAIYYQEPLHRLPLYAGGVSDSFDFSVSEDICGRVFSLPMHPYLRDDEISRISELIVGTVGERKKRN